MLKYCYSVVLIEHNLFNIITRFCYVILKIYYKEYKLYYKFKNNKSGSEC